MTKSHLLDPASGWIEMVDDLGPRVCIDTAGEWTDLRARLVRRGVDIVDDPSSATTLILDESALGQIDLAAPSVTILCMITNRWSPLHWLDGGPRGSFVRLSGVRRRVEQHGRTTRTFGVFRSTTQPLAVIGLDTPNASRLTVSALGVHISGWRRGFLRASMQFGPVGRMFAPGWLVIAVGEGRDLGLDPTGQIGYQQSVGFTRVMGEPPRYIEREAAMDVLAAETAALEELSVTTMASVVPSVVRSPSDVQQPPGGRAPSLVMSLLAGRPLRPRQMTDGEIDVWTRRAARLLDELQSVSLHADGTVLVHGDYWLGNMLVDGEQIVGLIDWETAHRGNPTEDRDFLGRGMASYLDHDRSLRSRLVSCLGRGRRS